MLALVRNIFRSALVALPLSLNAVAGDASTMLRAVSSDPYPETMTKLQRAIEANGYVFSRVQRVDYGLRRRGYDIPPYRVVFFGKPEEIRFLSVAQPRLLPFLPLKIILYQDGDKVVLLAADPSRLAQVYPGPANDGLFQTWRRDIQTILREAARSE